MFFLPVPGWSTDIFWCPLEFLSPLHGCPIIDIELLHPQTCLGGRTFDPTDPWFQSVFCIFNNEGFFADGVGVVLAGVGAGVVSGVVPGSVGVADLLSDVVVGALVPATFYP